MSIRSQFTKVAGVFALVTLAAAALSACSATGGSSVNQAYLVTQNVDNLNCSTVDNRTNTVKSLQATADFVNNANGKQTSDILALNKGATSLKPLQTALSTKLKACSQKVKKATDGTQTDVTDGSGKIHLPVYMGTTGSTVVYDSTKVAATPPLMDFYQRYHNNAVTWADAVKALENSQGYIDGLNKYASAGSVNFNWNDLKRYAQSTTVDARIIAVYNKNVTDAQARDAVRPYIGNDADSLPVVHYACVVNTMNEGTQSNIIMGRYLDCESMIRVSLVPIIYDASGKPIKLDASGAGIFVDCFNLHWIPQTYTCPPGTCTPPPAPSAPPSLTPPPSGGCAENCTPTPTCVYDCPKDHRNDTTPPGGVTTQPNDPYEPPATVTAPTHPAPVQPANQAPTSTSQAGGATAPDPSRAQPPAGTGTTSTGGGGGVNPSTGGGTNNGVNSTPVPNPFGG